MLSLRAGFVKLIDSQLRITSKAMAESETQAAQGGVYLKKFGRIMHENNADCVLFARIADGSYSELFRYLIELAWVSQ